MTTLEYMDLFITSRQSKGLSPETIRWYKGILEAFANQYPKLPKHPEEIEKFISTVNAKDERKHGYFRALRAFYRFLHRRYQVPDLISQIDAPRRSNKTPRYLIPSELEKLLSFPHSPKVMTALIFLIDTGCRIGEVARITVNDIIDTPWGYVVKVNGKTGMRLVPISTETHQTLINNLPFCYTTYRLRRKIAQAFIDAGVKGTSHCLRHTFCTLWRGDDIVLQQIVGHKHLSTTMLYRHLRTELASKQHFMYTPLKMVYSARQLIET